MSDKSISLNPAIQSQKETIVISDTQGSLLVNNLSFSHFIELFKADSATKRKFYEVQAIKNNWGVRDLKRAIDSLLYERTGLSTDRNAVLNEYLSKKK
ncbi:MAG: hypothetical protein IPH34_11875 [Chitinophagaceae bacterium]|nr:hypothetical protein [Chitinophagaceae bacterium]